MRTERRVSPTHGQILVDAQRVQQLGRIADAARIYRELMDRYMTEQVARVEQGHTLDELVIGNYGLFEAVRAAEEELFAAVDECRARQSR